MAQEKVKYSPNSAGRKMVTEVLTARSSETIGTILNRLRTESKFLKTMAYVYVVDENNRLVGVTSLKSLFLQPANTPVRNIMRTSLVTISPEAEEEKVAHLALKHSIKTVPVVEKGKLLGAVPADRIFHIINRALQEDILHFAGIHKAHLEYENTLAVPLDRSVLHRLPWLLIGLVGIILAAAFISAFEKTLEKYLILAFFIPAIVYMSDAVGTQHQTLFVRDLAIMGKDLNLKAYLFKQMLIALLLGALIGAIVFLVISFFWNQPFIAFVIGSAMSASLLVTSFTALATTLLISRWGMDPALGSGPFATIVSDVTSVIIYFIVAFLFLGA